MNKLVWMLNGVLIVALGVAVVLLLDDDESTAKAKPAPATTTTVPAQDFVAGGPNADRLKKAVSDLDLSAFLENDDYDGWEIGKISEVKGPVNIMLMMTGEQTGVFYGSDSDCIPEDFFATLLDPGDIVLWDTAGNDTRLCSDEIIVVKEAS